MKTTIQGLSVSAIIVLVQSCAGGFEQGKWPPMPVGLLENVATGWPAARLVEESGVTDEALERPSISLDDYKRSSGNDFGVSNTKDWYVVRVSLRGEMRGPPSYYVAERSLVLHFQLKRNTMRSREWVILVNASEKFNRVIVR